MTENPEQKHNEGKEQGHCDQASDSIPVQMPFRMDGFIRRMRQRVYRMWRCPLSAAGLIPGGRCR